MFDLYGSRFDRAIGKKLQRPLGWTCDRVDNFTVARVIAGAGLLVAAASIATAPAVPHRHTEAALVFNMLMAVSIATWLMIVLARAQRAVNRMRLSGDALDAARAHQLRQAYGGVARQRSACMAACVFAIPVVCLFTPLSGLSTQVSMGFTFTSFGLWGLAGYAALYFRLRPPRRIRDRIADRRPQFALLPAPVNK